MRILRAFLGCVMRYALCVNLKVCEICVIVILICAYPCSEATKTKNGEN